MKKVLILGCTNVGKTLFMLNFAEYLGFKKLFLKFEYHNNKVLTKEMSIETAKSTLSSNNPHTTKCLQSTNLKIKIYKGKKEFEIIDSSGLIDGIHPDVNIRKGIIQTLKKIETSNLILHIIDISLFNKSINQLSKIDKQIIEYGIIRGKYVLLANKIDLDKSGENLKLLQDEFKNVYIIPISALYKTGFDEVKSFVINSI